jgi:hypothetical protein
VKVVAVQVSCYGVRMCAFRYLEFCRGLFGSSLPIATKITPKCRGYDQTRFLPDLLCTTRCHEYCAAKEFRRAAQNIDLTRNSDRFQTNFSCIFAVCEELAKRSLYFRSRGVASGQNEPDGSEGEPCVA